jgi:gas vesicle protein
MTPKKKVTVHKNNIFTVVAGIVVGSLAGAVTMLLLAPKSRKETRDQIMEKGIELRDRATELVEESVNQVRSTTDKLSMSGRQKAKELIEQGQALVVEQLDNVSQAAQAGKKAVQAS